MEANCVTAVERYTQEDKVGSSNYFESTLQLMKSSSSPRILRFFRSRPEKKKTDLKKTDLPHDTVVHGDDNNYLKLSQSDASIFFRSNDSLTAQFIVG